MVQMSELTFLQHTAWFPCDSISENWQHLLYQWFSWEHKHAIRELHAGTSPRSLVTAPPYTPTFCSRSHRNKPGLSQQRCVRHVRVVSCSMLRKLTVESHPMDKCLSCRSPASCPNMLLLTPASSSFMSACSCCRGARLASGCTANRAT